MNITESIKDTLSRTKDARLYRLHTKFQAYTMIGPATYVANLKLARWARPIPGAIVECGTWKGGMIAGIAQLFGADRDYFLYDSFEGLPEVEPIDGPAAKQWQQAKDSPGYYNNCTAAEVEAATAMSLANITNANLIKGWFENTLPQATFPNGIALLRMDADWYKSTYEILHWLFPFVNANGLILIDDYYQWDGCSKAVHDYLSEHKRPERIFSYKEVCFIKKIGAGTLPPTAH